VHCWLGGRVTNRTGVYMIENIVSHKCYVGSAAKMFKGRFSAHLSTLRKGVHRNKHLQNSYNKYGESVFKFKILEVCSPEDCIEREQVWLDLINPEYNIRRVAGSSLGVKFSDETKRKLSYAASNRSPEIRKKMGDIQRGRKASDDTRKRLSAAMYKRW